MSAITLASGGRRTSRREGKRLSYPVTAGVVCMEGGLAVLDSSGYVKPGVTATGLVPVGMFIHRADNSAAGASNGDILADVESGIFRWENGDSITIASIGDRCYIGDDQTVYSDDGTGTRSVAGVVVDVDDYGVWVDTGMSVLITTGLLAANNLSDLGTKATARGNLGGGANKMPVTLGSVSVKATDNGVLRWVSPVAGTIDHIYSVLNAAITGADATLTAAIGATPVTTGVITITESGSAAGDVDSCNPSAAKTLAVGDVLSITVGGGGTATGSTATVSILITPTE
jgi:hypothetical protein